MKNRRVTTIIVLVLLLTIGFAAVTTTLIVNNSVLIGSRSDDFVVYFSKAIAEDGGTAEISNDKKVITYSTKELKQIGDRAELDYRVTNDSHQYDANVLIDIAFDNPSYSQYFDIQYETFNNSTSELLEAQTTKEGRIKIKLIKPVLDDVTVLFTITLNVEAVERESVADETYYTLIFDTQGGDSIDSKRIQSYHEYGSLPTPNKNGFSFVGWYKGTELVDEHSTIDNSEEIIEAHWNRNSYQLTIDLDGGSSSQELTQTILYEGTMSITEPTRNRYIFNGWEVIGTDSSIDNNVFKMGYENTTLKAKWVENSYSVKFNGNGSTSGSMSDQKMYIGESVNLSSNGFTKSNYNFAGWATSSSATSATYANQASVKNLTTTVGGTVNLYAVWTPKKYTIKYNGNGSTSGSMSSQSVNYDSTVTLITNSFARTDYTFAGWSTTSSGIVGYKNKASVKNLTTGDSTINLYAVWVKNVTNFAYNGSNGTSGSIQSYKVLADGTYQLEVWGAQGGKTPSTGAGGLGGYSKGNKALTKGTNLYIGVGGNPATASSSTIAGGYNGGSKGLIDAHASYNPYIHRAPGGGATHIAMNNNRGVLSGYVNNKSEVLIVAGGGGGGGNYVGVSAPGGTGGGLTSGNMYMIKTSGAVLSANYGARYDGVYVNKDTGVTQCGSSPLSPYPIDLYPGSFGQGSSLSSGGGGYYGGAMYATCNFTYSGGGGSGYVGGVTNGTSTSGQRSGHGYARITLVSLS